MINRVIRPKMKEVIMTGGSPQQKSQKPEVNSTKKYIHLIQLSFGPKSGCPTVLTEPNPISDQVDNFLPEPEPNPTFKVAKPDLLSG